MMEIMRLSGKYLSKEKVTHSLKDNFDFSDQLLNEIVETVFNSDNEIYSEEILRKIICGKEKKNFKLIESIDNFPLSDGSEFPELFE